MQPCCRAASEFGAGRALITESNAAAYAISAHNHAETYNTLTRRGDRAPFCFTAAEAWAAILKLAPFSWA
jgi:hypothetical protein